jgi:glycosyltransferase involved in cell wall biosynthesis
MRYVYKADLLITVTEGKQHPGYAEIYRGWGVDPLVIWNASRAVTAIPPLPERFTLGYYGYVRDTSMFEWLVAAIETLPAEQRPALRVAGAGVAQERVRELLMQASARLNIPVQVTGAFEMRELGALMAQCSAQFCVYSLRDGNMSRTMPVKLFDAVAHGRPVIGNEGTLMGDYIRDRNWGWTVTEGDVAGLARAIASANERLHGLSVPPPLAAAPTWEEQGDKLCAAYERLLAGA